MSINVVSALVGFTIALIVLGVLGFGLMLVRDGRHVWGAAVMLSMTGILIGALAVLYH